MLDKPCILCLVANSVFKLIQQSMSNHVRSSNDQFIRFYKLSYTITNQT